MAPRRELLLVGCGKPDSGAAGHAGIAVFAFNETTGEAVHLATTPQIDNPNFLAIDSDTRLVYATSEDADKPEGATVVYALDPDSGRLSWIERQTTLGSLPCHLCLDQTGDFLFVTNFDRALPGDAPAQSFALFPTRSRTGLAPATASRKHLGSGPRSPFQDTAHPHCARVSADNRFVLVTDLGTDAIMSYPFDASTGELGSVSSSCAMPPGSGPRHLVFSPDGRTAFISNEMNSTVAALDYEPRGGQLSVRQILSTLPTGFSGDNYPADLHLARDAGFLYISNRGHDSIARFSVNGPLLHAAGHSPTFGAWPRSFAISPSDKYLVVANQRSNSLVTLAIDARDQAGLRKVATFSVAHPLFVAFVSA